MERTRELTTFAIDGYQISATFADSRNTTALGPKQLKMLSSHSIMLIRQVVGSMDRGINTIRDGK